MRRDDAVEPARAGMGIRRVVRCLIADFVREQLIRKVTETFGLTAAVLYDRRTGQFHLADPADFEGPDDQLRYAALHGHFVLGCEQDAIVDEGSNVAEGPI